MTEPAGRAARRIPGRAGLAEFAATGLAVAALLLGAGPAVAADPVFAPPDVIDGPAPGVGPLGGLAVAPDGTGGLVYLKSVAGVAHVFLAPLTGGRFGAPQQIDSGLAGAATQPVIGAADGGVLLVAFVSGGDLWVATVPAAGRGVAAPQDLAAGGASPAIAVSTFGKAYLAFTTGPPGARSVRAAYRPPGGVWALATGVLDATAGGDAGDGDGSPAVTAAGDGVGAVAWGEGGHIYTRRVWRAQPSVVTVQVDPATVDGLPVTSATLPRLAAGDDSSYIHVAFRATVSQPGGSQDRVVVRRLQASQAGAPTTADGITDPGGGGATDPRVAESPGQRAIVTARHESAGELFALPLGGAGAPALSRLDDPASPGASAAVPAATGFVSGLVAWSQPPPPLGGGAVLARFYAGSAFGPILTASGGLPGAPDPSGGLAAAGDGGGDVALAWVQQEAGGSAIAVARLIYPPGGFAPVAAARYSASAEPRFAWTASRELWGPVTYSVSVDGRPAGVTAGTSFRPGPLSDGPHTWQVTATNQLGETSTARPVEVWIDTVRPALGLLLAGPAEAGRPLRLAVRVTDAPPPEPAAAASGVPLETVSWGDGAATTVVRGAVHRYARPGRYRVRVRAVDRAGNPASVSRLVVIAQAASR